MRIEDYPPTHTQILVSKRTRIQGHLTVQWMEMIRRIVRKEAAKLGVEVPDVPRRVLLSTITEAKAFVGAHHAHG